MKFETLLTHSGSKIFVSEVQSGTLLTTLGSTGANLLKNIMFLLGFQLSAGRTELGRDGGWTGAYRVCHSSQAGVSCTLRLRPVGSGQWGRSQ